jgi:methionyl-tRNA synthetase
MSKSKGNVVDPKQIADAYGLDAFRYFMLREVPFGQDGDFSQRALIDRINSDLGNDLGNLLNRIIGMSGKYFNFKVSSVNVKKYHQKELDEVDAILDNVEKYLFNMQINKYLEDIWKVLTIANKAIGDYEPWAMMKNNQEDQAMALVALITNIMAKVSILLQCVLPSKIEKISNSLGIIINNQLYTSLLKDKNLLDDVTITKIDALFPRIEEPLLKTADVAKAEVKIEKKDNAKNEEPDNLITIDQFFQTELKKALKRLLPYEIEELKHWLKSFTKNKPELIPCLRLIE